MIRRWTEKENEILRKFWKSNRPSDEILPLLPGRTIFSVKRHVQDLGIAKRKPGPYPHIEKSIVTLMKEHGPLCTLEMGSMLLCDRRQVDTYIRRMRTKKKVYVAGYIETRSGHLSKRWAFGSGTDVKYPEKGEPVPVCIIAAKATAIARDPITAALFGRAS